MSTVSQIIGKPVNQMNREEKKRYNALLAERRQAEWKAREEARDAQSRRYWDEFNSQWEALGEQIKRKESDETAQVMFAALSADARRVIALLHLAEQEHCTVESNWTFWDEVQVASGLRLPAFRKLFWSLVSLGAIVPYIEAPDSWTVEWAFRNIFECQQDGETIKEAVREWHYGNRTEAIALLVGDRNGWRCNQALAKLCVAAMQREAAGIQ